MELPLEVIEHIMYFCDGQTLLQLGRVDPLYETFLRLPGTKLEKMWAKICDVEIPEMELNELLRELAPSYWAEPEKVDWVTIYKTWDARRRMKGITDIFLTPLKTEGIINVVKASGDWVLVGTSEPGRLIAFNLQDEEHVLFKGCGVLDIQLRVKKSSNERILPGLLHCEAILHLEVDQDFIFNLCTGKVTKKLNREFGFYQIRWFENFTVAIINQGGALVSVTDEKTKESISWKPEYQVTECDYPDEGKLVILEAWKDKFWVARRSGWIIELDYNLKVISSYLSKHLDFGKENYYRWNSQIHRINDHSFNLRSEVSIPTLIRLEGLRLSPKTTAFLNYCGAVFIGGEDGCFRVHTTRDHPMGPACNDLSKRTASVSSYITDICPFEGTDGMAVLVSTKHKLYLVYLGET